MLMNRLGVASPPRTSPSPPAVWVARARGISVNAALPSCRQLSGPASISGPVSDPVFGPMSVAMADSLCRGATTRLFVSYQHNTAVRSLSVTHSLTQRRRTLDQRAGIEFQPRRKCAPGIAALGAQAGGGESFGHDRRRGADEFRALECERHRLDEMPGRA